jgi:outer membrane protein assembly factor BamA
VRMRAAFFLISCCLLLLHGKNVHAAGEPADSTLEKVIIGNITVLGNKITKERIIFRELTFKKGDATDTLEAIRLFKRSEENLYNTSLFNSVRINWIVENGFLNVFILVAERWYIFPLPIFEIAERNFNVWWQTKDYSRIVYGGILNWNNFRGRNEVLASTIRLGYTQRMSFYYSIPYINRQQRSGLTFGFAFSRNHQSSVRSVDNKVLYYKDEERFSKKEFGGSVAYTNRRDLYHTHVIEGGYRQVEVLDTIVRLNRDYFQTGESKMRYSVLRYFFKSDHRDIAVYPLRGYYLDFEIVKNGFSFFKDDIDLAYVTAQGKKFWPLGGRFYFGTGISTKYTTGNDLPYYLSRGLGYGRDYLRGYEYYVIDGQNYALLKTNLKFELLPKKEIYVGLIPLSKFSTIPYAFYLNLYSDAGYVKDYRFTSENPLTNSWQISYGGGIDFVTYYDMVFRFEYSFNKLGESGFFLHFTAPI